MLNPYGVHGSKPSIKPRVSPGATDIWPLWGHFPIHDSQFPIPNPQSPFNIPPSPLTPPLPSSL